MEITEKLLLDNYDGLSKGMSKLSIIKGQQINWDYRTGIQEDESNPVCYREHASEITLEFNRYGKIEIDPACDNHPTLQKIKDDEEKLYGTQI